MADIHLRHISPFLTRMQKKLVPMISSAPGLKQICTKTQYFVSGANNPTGASCFGLFGTFCPYLLVSQLILG